MRPNSYNNGHTHTQNTKWKHIKLPDAYCQYEATPVKPHRKRLAKLNFEVWLPRTKMFFDLDPRIPGLDLYIVIFNICGFNGWTKQKEYKKKHPSQTIKPTCLCSSIFGWTHKNQIYYIHHRHHHSKIPKYRKTQKYNQIILFIFINIEKYNIPGCGSIPAYIFISAFCLLFSTHSTIRRLRAKRF